MRIFTGVGLIRLKNWARVFSCLIIGIPVFCRRHFMERAFRTRRSAAELASIPTEHLF